MTASTADASLGSAATASPRERSLWIIGSTAAAFTAARPIVEAVRARYPRFYSVLTPRDAALSPWLRDEYQDSVVEDRPPASVSACVRLVRRHNPRLMLILDGPVDFENALLRAARRRQIPIAVVATRHGGDVVANADLLSVVDRTVALSPDRARTVIAQGMNPTQVTDASGDDVVGAASAALFTLLRRDLKALRSERTMLSRWLEGLARATVDRPLPRRLLRRRVQRIDSVEELADRLGRPQTILCLGNGPSSEDPRVRDVTFDAVFRVNHMWLQRGVLTDPDVVFTGTTDTVKRVGRAIIAMSQQHSEGRMLLAGLLRRGRPFHFITLERVGVLPSDPSWGETVPTNGAFMLATAVALRPARLVVAGIDLFRHRAGAYPGDPHTPNSYTPRHAAELDEQVILRTLDAYRGELILIGDVLAAAWAERGTILREASSSPTVVSDAAGRYAPSRGVAQ